MQSHRVAQPRLPIPILVRLLHIHVSEQPEFTAGKEAYDCGNWEEALKEWRPLAEEGLPEVQVILGAMYAIGRGVPRDYAQAYLWMNRAAGQGFAMGIAARNELESFMTNTQLGEAEALVHEDLPQRKKKTRRICRF